MGALVVQESGDDAKTGLTDTMRSGITKVRMSRGAACLLMFYSLNSWCGVSVLKGFL
jgi:hypothetical protein